jgi:hypothetical protein
MNISNNEFVITLDIDWAPDFVIKDLIDLLLSHNSKSTWFVTHDTIHLHSLRKHSDFFELGIHPNFLPMSTHGDTAEEVIEFMMNLVPEAVSSRSHSVFQSGSILELLANHSPIENDATIFLPEMEGIKHVLHPLPNGGQLKRLPFFWADDYEMCCQPADWTLARHIDVKGLKVMMFHPIHIFLNTNDFTQYTHIKESIGPLNSVSEEKLLGYRNNEKGARTVFIELINYMLKCGTSRTIKEVLNSN